MAKPQISFLHPKNISLIVSHTPPQLSLRFSLTQFRNFYHPPSSSTSPSSFPYKHSHHHKRTSSKLLMYPTLWRPVKTSNSFPPHYNKHSHFHLVFVHKIFSPSISSFRIFIHKQNHQGIYLGARGAWIYMELRMDEHIWFYSGESSEEIYGPGGESIFLTVSIVSLGLNNIASVLKVSWEYLLEISVLCSE